MNHKDFVTGVRKSVVGYQTDENFDDEEYWVRRLESFIRKRARPGIRKYEYRIMAHEWRYNSDMLTHFSGLIEIKRKSVCNNPQNLSRFVVFDKAKIDEFISAWYEENGIDREYSEQKKRHRERMRKARFGGWSVKKLLTYRAKIKKMYHDNFDSNGVIKVELERTLYNEETYVIDELRVREGLKPLYQ